MPKYQLFAVRAVLGLVIATILTRFFFQRTDPVYIVGIAIIMVGLAYFSEYLKNRKNR